MDKEDFKILIYDHFNGIPTFKDSDILDFYNRIVDNDLDQFMFSDGTIEDGNKFLNLVSKNQILLFVLMYKKEYVGVVWLNRFQGKKAQFHYCAFKEFHGHKELKDIGTETLKRVLNWKYNNGEFLVDVVIGYVPITNKAANTYTKKIGGIKVGIIPHSRWNKQKAETEDTILYYVTRESIKDW